MLRALLGSALVCIGGVAQELEQESASDTASTPPNTTEGEAGASVPQRRVSRTPLPGDIVGVLYHDGRRFQGMLIEQSDDAVRFSVSGVEIEVDLDDVERVYFIGTPMERYMELREGIADDDAAGLIDLARWLLANDLVELALLEARLALRAEPRNAEAMRLVHRLEVVNDLRKSDRDSAESSTDGAERTGRSEVPWASVPLLAPGQIQLLKVYEVDLADPPRVAIGRETVDRLLREHADHELIPNSDEGRAAFRDLSALEVLDVMFRVQARELYPEVEVIGHPRSFRIFRDEVLLAWLATSCASTACHGGGDAGGLQLVGGVPRSDEAVYTNFLILDRFRTSLGQPLIDYDRPESSLLVQFASPQEEVLWPHPEVAGWSPSPVSRNTRLRERTIAWIEAMYQPRPTYPIVYPPEPVQEAMSPGSEPPPPAPEPTPR
ncbi:MAG: hypothetical protein AAGI30_05800 [Planctomycetota bacterium]